MWGPPPPPRLLLEVMGEGHADMAPRVGLGVGPHPPEPGAH